MLDPFRPTFVDLRRLTAKHQEAYEQVRQHLHALAAKTPRTLSDTYTLSLLLDQLGQLISQLELLRRQLRRLDDYDQAEQRGEHVGPG